MALRRHERPHPVEAEAALVTGHEAVGVQVPPGPVALKAKWADGALARRRLVGALVAQRYRAAPPQRRAQLVEQLGERRAGQRRRVVASHRWGLRRGVVGRVGAISALEPGGWVAASGKRGERRFGGRAESRREAGPQPRQQRCGWAGWRTLRRVGLVVGR